MGWYDETVSSVRGCDWWDGKRRLLCPLNNDCCTCCMHPDAPREKDGNRMPTIGGTGEVPEWCPLRKGPLCVGLSDEVIARESKRR